jgi:fatty-acyl-CoA synthase
MFYGDWLYRRETLSPNKVAIIDAMQGDGEITYLQWNRRVNQMANFFRQKLGIEKGDRISIYASNRLEYLDALFAANKLGATLQVVNWRLMVGELESIITDVTPKVLIYSQEWTDGVKTLRAKLKSVEYFVCLDEDTQEGDFSWVEEQKQWSHQQPPKVELDWEDPWVICYTGGTTGLPKGAILNYRCMTWNSINTVMSWGLRPDDIVPHFMPMFHTGGINVMMLPLVHIGGTTIICRDFNVDQLFDQIEQLRVTFFFGVPAMLLMMIQHPRWESVDLSKVRLVMAGGGNCPSVVYEAFQEKGIEFKEGYGLTEAGPNTFWLPEELARGKMGSVGRPLFHVDVKIVDDDDQPIGIDQVGHLKVRGPHVFGGYWNQPEATADVLVNGWLHTGDLAKMDKDGCYYIVGRSKDMIKSGGENIYPAEVEDVIHGHGAVSEAAVIPVPDPKWGEVGRAIIVLKTDSNVTEDELIQWMRQRLAHFKVPKSVVFLDELPKTAASKVDKKLLIEQYGGP